MCRDTMNAARSDKTVQGLVGSAQDGRAASFCASSTLGDGMQLSRQDARAACERHHKTLDAMRADVLGNTATGSARHRRFISPRTLCVLYLGIQEGKRPRESRACRSPEATNPCLG
jgi:hypothetical protein